MTRDMAHKEEPLAYTPDGPYWADDRLGYRIPERVRVVFGYAVVVLVTLAIVLFLSLPGRS